MENVSKRRCLNCGEPLVDGGRFCHCCGQQTAAERLTARNFAVSLFAGLTRINRGVLFTCCNLLIRPWRVIADYIRGRRVRYTTPVQLLLVLSFLTVVVGGVVDIAETDQVNEVADVFVGNGVVAESMNRFLTFCLNSTVIQYLVMLLPAIPAIMFVNRRKGEQRYNIAEYLLAAVYMSDAILLFQMLLTPLDLLSPVLSVAITYCYIIFVSWRGVYLSISHLGLSRVARIRRVVSFYVLAIILYFLFIAVPLCLTVLLVNGQ